MSYQLDGLRVAQARQALQGRDGKALTQGELAERAEIHRVTMTRIENGDAKVSLELLERLSGLLDKSRPYLLGEPEQIDPLEEARGRIGQALAKVATGMDELADVVETLNQRAAEAAAPVTVKA